MCKFLLFSKIKIDTNKLNSDNYSTYLSTILEILNLIEKIYNN